MSSAREKSTSLWSLVFIAVLLISCASPTLQPTAQGTDNSLIGWPFDPQTSSWTIENGYNTGPDHMQYELDSFDFQRRGGTTGQLVLSPVTGDSVAFGNAYPGDGSSGQCVSIGPAGQNGFHLLVCHLLNPVVGSVSRGAQLGTVSGGANGDHIHITLYYLDPSVPDTAGNASQRRATPFSDPWRIAGCNYPSDGGKNQWAGVAVPCGNLNPGTPLPTQTPDPNVACRAKSGFATAKPAAALANQFITNPAVGEPKVPFEPNTVAYVVRTFSVPEVGRPDLEIRFEILEVCSPGVTPQAVRSFFTAQMPGGGWNQADTFPYSGDLSSSCGDPYCWSWAAYASDAFRFASLETVSQVGAVAIYRVRLGQEFPRQS